MAIPARDRRSAGEVLARPFRRASDLAARLRPHVSNASTRWIGSRRCIGRILEDSVDAREFTTKTLVSRGQRRVVQADTPNGQFVLHLSLRRAYVRRLEWASEVSRSHGVAVVPLRRSDSRLAALFRYGTFFALFDFVTGRQLEGNCSPAALERVAQLFARLHSVGLSPSSSAIAQPWPVAPPPGRDLPALLERWERLLSTAPISRDDPECRAVLRRLAESAPRRYTTSLVHGDAHLKNLIQKPDGGMVLLDLEGMDWGLPLLELVFLLYQLRDRDDARIVAFLKRYWEDAHDALRSDWRGSSGFWLLAGQLHLLDQQLVILAWSERFGDPAYTGRMRAVCNNTWNDVRTGAHEHWSRH